MKVLFYFLGIGFVLSLLAFAGRRWGPGPRRDWNRVLAVLAGCMLLDVLALVGLPRLGLSYGNLMAPLVLFHLSRLVIVLPLPLIALALSRRPAWSRALFTAMLIVQVGLTMAELDGLYIEPFRLGTTRVSVAAPAFLPDRPLRVLHITDIHVERITRRERDLLRQVELARPDLIVLTGDYVNVDYLKDARAVQDTRWLFSQLHAPYGVYAELGTTDASFLVAPLFDGLDIHVLDDRVERLVLPGGDLYLVGVTIQSAGDKSDVLSRLMKRVPSEGYSLLLFHTPDLIKTASRKGVDLYLAGHTHGGQIRAPFYGAIITASTYGKQYEMGAYRVGGTLMYVSRGVGMEGLGMPRMRFLCPPEIELFELGPQ